MAKTPREILKEQAIFPKEALGGTPLSPLGEGITSLLSSIANALPELPALPSANSSQGAGLPKIKSVIKGIEEAMPDIAGIKPPEISDILPDEGAIATKGTRELIFE